MKLWLPMTAIIAGLIYTAIQLFTRGGFASIEMHRFVALWMIVSYVFLIAFDIIEKKRSISMPVQTLLGTLVASAATALTGANAEQIAIAALIGTLLGWTVDLWTKLVQWA